MNHRIVVINPNSSQHITDAISRCVQPHRDGSVTVDCLTLVEGPPGIVTRTHQAQVVAPLQALMAREAATASAFVIACFGDPGVLAGREMSGVPVFGIGESSFYVAMSMADRFGVISTDEGACQQHERYVRELGIAPRMVGDVSIDIHILDLEKDPQHTLDRLTTAGLALKARGAEALVTGCAGLAPFKDALQDRVQLPVIEPALYTVGLASGVVRSSFRAR